MRTCFATFAFLALAVVVPLGTWADESGSSLPNGALGVRFNFNTSVQTPKGKKSASGTISIKKASSGLSLTVATSGGTTKTIPLVFENGTLKPDTSKMPPPSGDSESQAAAKALLSNMKVAAAVGMAARKSGGKGFNVDVTLTPVGSGTPMPASIAMSATPASSGSVAYTGQVEAQTTTQLPPSSGLDPQQLVKSAGIAVASHGMTPYGRAAVAIVHHRQVEKQQEAANGPLPDAMRLSITTHFAGGRFRDIAGTQTDQLTIASKSVTIVSNWSFVKAP
jgi:hypothetical protein